MDDGCRGNCRVLCCRRMTLISVADGCRMLSLNISWWVIGVYWIKWADRRRSEFGLLHSLYLSLADLGCNDLLNLVKSAWCQDSRWMLVSRQKICVMIQMPARQHCGANLPISLDLTMFDCCWLILSPIFHPHPVLIPTVFWLKSHENIILAGLPPCKPWRLSCGKLLILVFPKGVQ